MVRTWHEGTAMLHDWVTDADVERLRALAQATERAPDNAAFSAWAREWTRLHVPLVYEHAE